MSKQVKNYRYLFILGLLIPNLCFSQVYNESTVAWRRGTAVVIFAGIGGGILGLSTLSFYGKPEEHAGNITTGALLGVLSGFAYLAFDSQKSNPYHDNSSNLFRKPGLLNDFMGLKKQQEEFPLLVFQYRY